MSTTFVNSERLASVYTRSGLLLDWWQRDAHRRPLWLAVAFGAGTATYFLLPNEPPSLLAAGAAGPALVLMLVAAHGAVRVFCWLMILFALGFGAGQLRVQAVEAPRLEKATPRFTAEACIRSITPRATYFEIIADHWTETARLPSDFVARLQWRSPPTDLRPGERIRVSARLFPLGRPVYPGTYDPTRIAFFEGIGGEGWIGRTTERIGNCRSATWLETARRWYRDRLLEIVPGSAGGLLVGVTTGWRGDIPRDDVDAMRESGLGHLLAISGLHVGLAVGLLLVSVRAGLALIPFLALRYPTKKWAAIAGLLGGCIYLAFSGGSVPTQRAMIMLGLGLVALLIDRVEVSLRPVAWAAVIVLALAPESILSPSFHLSFAAVIGLIAVFESWRRYRNTKPPSERRLPSLVRYLMGVSATTLIATFATMPFAAFHFHQIALVSLGANLVAIPIFAFWVMPTLLIGTFLLPLGLEELPWRAAAEGSSLILATGHFLTGWDGALARVGIVPYWGIGVFTAGSLWWAIWHQRWRWAGAAVGAVGLIAPWTVSPPDLIAGEDHVALSDRDGRYWLWGRPGFVTDIWMRELATDAIPLTGEPLATGAEVTLACDAQACLYTTPDGVVAIVFDPAAQYECGAASVSYSRMPLATCGRWPKYDAVAIVTLDDGVVLKEDNAGGSRPWDAR
jgi:competence protein ComEC